MSLLSRLYTSTATIAAAFTLTAAPAMAQTAASDLRTALNTTLAEHVYLAAATTAAALGGRSGEFKDAAGALDGNSVTLSRAIGSVYGDDASLPSWPSGGSTSASSWTIRMAWRSKTSGCRTKP